MSAANIAAIAQLIASIGSTISAPIASALGSTSAQVQQMQSLIAELEANADNPALVAGFAHDIAAGAVGMPLIQVLAIKVWTMAQNPATYNPMMVMSEGQLIQSQLAQQNSSFFGGLAGLFPSGTTITTPATPSVTITAP